MCDSEQAPSLESAEIVELAGALSLVSSWINCEKYEVVFGSITDRSFAAQVRGLFNGRIAMQNVVPESALALQIQVWQCEMNPVERQLKRQADDMFTKLHERGFRVLQPVEMDLKEENEGAFEFMIRLDEEVSDFVSVDLDLLGEEGGYLETLTPVGTEVSKPIRVRLYPRENVLPNEKDGELLNHLKRIEHECIVAIPGMDYMEGNLEVCGYAMYQISQVEGETVVTKLNVDTPLTRKDNRTLQEF